MADKTKAKQKEANYLLGSPFRRNEPAWTFFFARVVFPTSEPFWNPCGRGDLQSQLGSTKIGGSVPPLQD